jgi:hypothetical protein
MNQLKVKIIGDPSLCRFAKDGATGTLVGFCNAGDVTRAIVNFGPKRGFEQVSLSAIVEISEPQQKTARDLLIEEAEFTVSIFRQPLSSTEIAAINIIEKLIAFIKKEVRNDA